MIVGIDGDVLRYELGSVAISKSEVFGFVTETPWRTSEVFDLVDNRVKDIIERSGASEYEIYLTGPGNYRFEIATIAPYKGQRTGDKPYHWATVGERLKLHWGAKEVQGIEADDILAIRASEEELREPGNYIIASRDKDLRQVSCHHYSWACGESQPERPTYHVGYPGEVDCEKNSYGGYKLTGHGLKFFYGQLLTGDTVDNIKGCPRIGPKIAATDLKFLNTEEELFRAVAGRYKNAYGDDWKKALEENARLLFLVRDRSWLEEEALGNNVFKYKVNKLWECPYDYSEYDSGRTDCGSQEGSSPDRQ